MSDLVEFLNALDEDEAIAKAAYAGPWVVKRLAPSVLADGDSADVLATDQTRAGWGIAEDHEGFGACTIPNAVHIARHDPVRVLADVGRLRQVIAVCEEAIKAGEIKPGTTWNDDAAGAEVATRILELIAGKDTP